MSGGSFWLLKQIIGQGIPLWPGGWGFYEWPEILTVRIGTWPLPGEREEIGDPKTKKSDLVRTLQEVSFIWTLESYRQYSWLYLSFYFWASNKHNEYKFKSYTKSTQGKETFPSPFTHRHSLWSTSNLEQNSLVQWCYEDLRVETMKRHVALQPNPSSVASLARTAWFAGRVEGGSCPGVRECWAAGIAEDHSMAWRHGWKPSEGASCSARWLESGVRPKASVYKCATEKWPLMERGREWEGRLLPALTRMEVSQSSKSPQVDQTGNRHAPPRTMNIFKRTGLQTCFLPITSAFRCSSPLVHSPSPSLRCFASPTSLLDQHLYSLYYSFLSLYPKREVILIEERVLIWFSNDITLCLFKAGHVTFLNRNSHICKTDDYLHISQACWAKQLQNTQQCKK